MRKKTIIATFAISIAALIAAACGGSGSGPAGNVKDIKSTTAGDITVTLASSTGEIKDGENDLMLSFADSSGKTVDVGAASLKFFMPAMGTMPEMNDVATLTTTNTPGKYRAKVNIEMAGTWEAVVNYEGPKGTGQARMTVNVK
jgi:YtkA-like protein